MRCKVLTSLGCSCKAVPASANDQQVQQSQPSQTSQNIQVLQQSTQNSQSSNLHYTQKQQNSKSDIINNLREVAVLALSNS